MIFLTSSLALKHQNFCHWLTDQRKKDKIAHQCHKKRFSETIVWRHCYSIQISNHSGFPKFKTFRGAFGADPAQLVSIQIMPPVRSLLVTRLLLFYFWVNCCSLSIPAIHPWQKIWRIAYWHLRNQNIFFPIWNESNIKRRWLFSWNTLATPYEWFWYWKETNYGQLAGYHCLIL